MSEEKDSEISRKQFIKNGFWEIANVVGDLFSDTLEKIDETFPDLIRPPGALPEEQFLKTCTRCGLCIKMCPFFVIRKYYGPAPFVEETPALFLKSNECRMCGYFRCACACPTGALILPKEGFPKHFPQIPPSDEHGLNAPPGGQPANNSINPENKSRSLLGSTLTLGPISSDDFLKGTTGNQKPVSPIVLAENRLIIGIARTRRKLCLRTKGIPCDACIRSCPANFQALSEDGKTNPPVVNPERCTGCGACESSCPQDPDRAIFVVSKD